MTIRDLDLIKTKPFTKKMDKIFFIAEIGNHNGDLKIAKKLIDGAKEALKFDAVKFQKET